jgi:hypothetical protein
MPEHPAFSRKASLADFLDNIETNNKSSKRGQNNDNYSREDTIAKNQQEFGHKKRIKP